MCHLVNRAIVIGNVKEVIHAYKDVQQCLYSTDDHYVVLYHRPMNATFQLHNCHQKVIYRKMHHNNHQVVVIKAQKINDNNIDNSSNNMTTMAFYRNIYWTPMNSINREMSRHEKLLKFRELKELQTKWWKMNYCQKQNYIWQRRANTFLFWFDPINSQIL